jgi:DNA-binding NtrC family response regulator
MKPRILIVDDDETFRWGLVGTLRKQGFAVAAVGSAFAALPSLAEVDLVVVDVVMPLADGFALATVARQRRPDLKIIYVTAHSRLANDDAALELGPLLEKPVELSTLVRVIRHQLGLPGTA